MQIDLVGQVGHPRAGRRVDAAARIGHAVRVALGEGQPEVGGQALDPEQVAGAVERLDVVGSGLQRVDGVLAALGRDHAVLVAEGEHAPRLEGHDRIAAAAGAEQRRQRRVQERQRRRGGFHGPSRFIESPEGRCGCGVGQRQAAARLRRSRTPSQAGAGGGSSTQIRSSAVGVEFAQRRKEFVRRLVRIVGHGPAASARSLRGSGTVREYTASFTGLSPSICNAVFSRSARISRSRRARRVVRLERARRTRRAGMRQRPAPRRATASMRSRGICPGRSSTGRFAACSRRSRTRCRRRTSPPSSTSSDSPNSSTHVRGPRRADAAEAVGAGRGHAGHAMPPRRRAAARAPPGARGSAVRCCPARRPQPTPCRRTRHDHGQRAGPERRR